MSANRPEQSESLFNVTPTRRRTYAIAFTLFSLIGYGVVIWLHVAGGMAAVNVASPSDEVGAAAMAWSIMFGFAIAHAAAFGLALVSAEIAGGTMVIADYLRIKLVVPVQERLRNEGRAEGREEGRAQANRSWREWNLRRREAEARGESFDEPEPYGEDE